MELHALWFPPDGLAFSPPARCQESSYLTRTVCGLESGCGQEGDEPAYCRVLDKPELGRRVRALREYFSGIYEVSYA